MKLNGDGLGLDFFSTALGSAFLTFSLIAFNLYLIYALSESSFGAVSYVRSVASTAVPLLTICVGVAFPALKFRESMPSLISTYFWGFLALSVISLVVFFGAISQFDIGLLDNVDLVAWSIMLGVGLGCLKFLESFFRVSVGPVVSNAIKGPVAFLFLLASLIVWHALSWIGSTAEFFEVLPITFLALGVITLYVSLRSKKEILFWSFDFKLISWGITRIPLALLKNMHFLLPLVLVAEFLGLESAAVFSVGLFFIRSGESLIGGVSSSVVYQVSKIANNNDKKSALKLEAVLYELCFFVCPLYLIGVVFLGKFIIPFLNNSYASSMFDSILIACSLLPYIVSVMYRGVLEAVSGFKSLYIPLLATIVFQLIADILLIKLGLFNIKTVAVVLFLSSLVLSVVIFVQAYSAISIERRAKNWHVRSLSAWLLISVAVMVIGATVKDFWVAVIAIVFCAAFLAFILFKGDFQLSKAVRLRI